MATVTKQQIIKKLPKLGIDEASISINGNTVRVEIPTKKTTEREEQAAMIAKVFGGKVKTKKTEIAFTGFSLVVKPKAVAKKSAKSTKKTVGTTVYYGYLSKLKLSQYDLTDLTDIDRTLSTTGKLPRTLKEDSDVAGVSDFNRAIQNLIVDGKGVDLTIDGFSVNNVIGAVAIVGGEPKADFVLLSINRKKISPSFYISYKLGNNAKGFQNYSGISAKSSSLIWNHPETEKFFKILLAMSKTNTRQDVKQEIVDDNIIYHSVYGQDYGGQYGLNNVNILAQGNITVSTTGVVKYHHMVKNGDNLRNDRNYCPVFGARNATGRGAKTPTGENLTGFRIGIFPRAYRTKWLTEK